MRRASLSTVVLLLALGAATARAQTDDELPALAGEAKARIQNLEQHLNDWDVEAAHAEWQALAALAGTDAKQVRYFAGRVAFEQGRYEDAVRELTAAGVGDRPGSWLKLAKDSLALTEGYETHESEHFIFRAPKGKDALLAPWALDALEAVRTALDEDLGYAPPDKIRVEIVSSAAELSRLSTLSREAIRTTGTIAICKFNKLIVTSPKAVLTGYDWLDTVAHEYVHLVVSRKSRNTVPIWMHEGLAKYLESRWKGGPGLALTPSSLALLGDRVRKGKLVTFEQMSPSMALLPTAQDAATAFAEVFFAIKLLDTTAGPHALKRLLGEMAQGRSDKRAVEAVTGKRWGDFEKAWMAFLRQQPFPKELIPTSWKERKQLADGKGKGKDKGTAEKEKPEREISFGDFGEIQQPDARRAAHLGELLRERRRMTAAAEQYKKAYLIAKDSYESLSNKYALTLLELGRDHEAQGVLEASLVLHPGSHQTTVHLGRLFVRQRAWKQAVLRLKEAAAVNPFDPEVQLLLARAAPEAQEPELGTRARAAAALLLKRTPAELDALISSLGQAAPTPAAPTPAARAPDAG